MLIRKVLAGAALMVVVVAGVSISPAHGHHGEELAGRLKAVIAEPAGSEAAWNIEAEIVEAGSGRPFDGARIRTEVLSGEVVPAEFVLEPTGEPGRYAATVESTSPQVGLRLHVSPVVGAAREVEPFTVERNLELAQGSATPPSSPDAAADASDASVAPGSADDGDDGSDQDAVAVQGQSASSSDDGGGALPVVIAGVLLLSAGAALYLGVRNRAARAPRPERA